MTTADEWDRAFAQGQAAGLRDAHGLHFAQARNPYRNDTTSRKTVFVQWLRKVSLTITMVCVVYAVNSDPLWVKFAYFTAAAVCTDFTLRQALRR